MNNYKQLRKLELELRHRYRLPTSGRHLGKASGFGVVPDGAKPYEPGDPPRLIDWHATARTGELTVRQRQIEHYARVLVVVDYPSRIVWGGGQAELRKSELTLATADALTHLLVWQGDYVNMLLLGSKNTMEPHMLAGQRAIKTVRARLAKSAPADTDQLATTLASNRLLNQNPLIVIVISDFLSNSWQEPLKQLSARREVIAVQVLDPWDLEMPNLGKVVRIGGQTIDTRKDSVRSQFNKMLQQKQQHREELFVELGIRHLLVKNNQPLVEQLINHLAPRKRRTAS